MKYMNIAIAIGVISMGALLVQGCSDSKKNGTPGPSSNPNGGGTGNGSGNGNSGGSNQGKTLAGINLNPRFSTVQNGNSSSLNVSVIFSDGSSSTVTANDTTITSSNSGLVQVDDGQDKVSASTIGTGKVNLSITVMVNGQSMSADFSDAVEVIAVSSGGGSSGGSGSGTPNPIPTTDLIKSTVLSAPAVVEMNQPAQVGVVNTHEDGNTSNNRTLNYFSVVSGKASVDADGNIFALMNNEAIVVRSYSIGAFVTGGLQAYNNVTVSNDLNVSSTATVATTGLAIMAPSFISMQERRQVRVYDLSSGSMAEVTSSCTFSIDDSAKAEMVNDLNGQSTWIHGKNVLGSNGVNSYFTLTATYNGMSQDFKCRVLPGNPEMVEKIDTNGNLVGRIWDTHVRIGRPYPKSATSYVLPIGFALARCVHQDKPGFFGPPNYTTNGNLPSLTVYQDAAGNNWGWHLYEFSVGITQLNVDPMQYVGRWTSPIVSSEFSDSDKWSWPQDGASSFFWDEHHYQSGGQTLVGTDFLLRILRPDGGGGVMNADGVRLTMWDKP